MQVKIKMLNKILKTFHWWRFLVHPGIPVSAREFFWEYNYNHEQDSTMHSPWRYALFNIEMEWKDGKFIDWQRDEFLEYLVVMGVEDIRFSRFRLDLEGSYRGQKLDFYAKGNSWHCLIGESSFGGTWGHYSYDAEFMPLRLVAKLIKETLSN